MAAPASASPLSPTLSAATTSSYDIVSDSSTMGRLTDTDSDDEIVWSVSEGSPSPGSECVPSDDDFVVLIKPCSPVAPAKGILTSDNDETGGVHTPVTASMTLVTAMNGLSLAPVKSTQKKKKTKKLKAAKQSQPSSAPSSKAKGKAKKRAAASPAGSSPTHLPKASENVKSSSFLSQHALNEKGGNAWFEEMAVGKHTGFGARPIVDDYSDRQSVISYDNESVGSPTMYEEASTFISSFLSDPDAKNDTVCRLTLLQSLIIELGFATPSLPDSLTGAKAFLKSRAFLNIREYLAVRGQGPDAVQRLLYPSKSALIKDIKKKRNPAPLKWVKQHGLQVLLVGWMH